LPWIPAALYAVPGSFRRAWKERDARERFLWVWFLVELAIICGSANKHRNYILPTLPVFSLLAGQGMSSFLRLMRQGQICLRLRTALVLSIASIAGMIAVWFALTDKWPHLTSSLTAVTVSFSAAACATIWSFERRRLALAGFSAFAGFLLCYVLVTGWILPGRDHRMAAAHFGKAIRSELAADQEVCVYRMVKAHGGKHPIIFYLDEPVSRVESKEELQQRMALGKHVFVVTYEPAVKELSKLGQLQRVKTMVTPRGFAPFRGPPLVLVKLTPRDIASKDGARAVPRIMLHERSVEASRL